MNGLQRVPEVGAEGAEELNTFGCPSPGHSLSQPPPARLPVPSSPRSTYLLTRARQQAAAAPACCPQAPPPRPTRLPACLYVCLHACVRAYVHACKQGRLIRCVRSGLPMYPHALVVPTRPFVHAAAQGIGRLFSLSLFIFLRPAT